MQGEKEMKGKVSTPTDGLSDQPTRLLEFHMPYGTKNIKYVEEEIKARLELQLQIHKV